MIFETALAPPRMIIEFSTPLNHNKCERDLPKTWFNFRVADNPRTWVRHYERVYRHRSETIEFPDMIVTAHDFLEATAVPRRSPGTGFLNNRFKVHRKKRRASLGTRFHQFERSSQNNRC